MFGVLDRPTGREFPKRIFVALARSPTRPQSCSKWPATYIVSEQHRRRAEALIELAREIDGALRLPEFCRRFVWRIAELDRFVRRSARWFRMRDDGKWPPTTIARRPLLSCNSHLSFLRPPRINFRDIVGLNGDSSVADSSSPASHTATHPDRDIDRALSRGLAEFLPQHPEGIIAGAAAHILGEDAAAALGWTDCHSGEVAGANGQLDGISVFSRSPH